MYDHHKTLQTTSLDGASTIFHALLKEHLFSHCLLNPQLTSPLLLISDAILIFTFKNVPCLKLFEYVHSLVWQAYFYGNALLFPNKYHFLGCHFH
jgi:hypothetical protein